MSRVRGGQVFVEIGADPRKLFKSLQDLNKHIGKIGAQLQGLGTRMTAFGAALTAPLALATRQFATFDDAIRLTGAVSGAAGADLQKLNDTARELGATTSFTAVQVASLMGELGRAGFSPDEINAMTGAVLNLARATGTDATLAAGIMAATLRQFGLNATDGARAADVLTKAANATFNTVEGLGESLKYAGPVAKSLGMSLEDTVAILGTLGNVGIQGSEAGTALRRLSVIAAGAGQELQGIFGVTNTDAAGNLKPLVSVLDEINTVTAGMPVAERTAKMAEAFGLLGITSANVLADSAGGVRGLADELRAAQGTAAATAKEMDAGLGGSFRIALSAIEGVQMALGNAFAPTLQGIVDGFTTTATAVTNFIKDNEALVVSIAKGIATFTAVSAGILGVGLAIGAVTGAIATVLSPIGLIVGGVVALVAAVDQATGVLGQLSQIAGQTFGGIYDAIAAGDLGMAMDVLWAGLIAGWTRGVATIMGYVDPWLAFFQNAFTFLVTEIQVGWEKMWAFLAQNTWGQYLLGFIDNIVNTAMDTFDWLVGSIQKAWATVQDYITGGRNAEARIKEIDNANAARAEQRRQERPGIEGRTNKSRSELEQIQRDSDARVAGLRGNANRIADERMNRRDGYNAAADQAQANLDNITRTAADRRETAGQVGGLQESITAATTFDELRGLASTFRELRDAGKLTTDQTVRLDEALDDAAERIMEAGMAGSTDTRKAAEAGAAAAQATATTSAAEVVGTFSGAALGQLGLGSNLAQKQLDTMKQIEQNTRDPMAGLVAD
jgi:TP901 family phage tail tape measure protein